MSHPDFVNRGSRLGKFIEECGEALAAAGKCVRFGMDAYNPLLPADKRESNREWLEREVNDLDEAIKLLRKSLHLEEPTAPTARTPEQLEQMARNLLVELALPQELGRVRMIADILKIWFNEEHK